MTETEVREMTVREALDGVLTLMGPKADLPSAKPIGIDFRFFTGDPVTASVHCHDRNQVNQWARWLGTEVRVEHRPSDRYPFRHEVEGNYFGILVDAFSLEDE